MPLSNADELVEVIEVVVRALDLHNVPYFVTGSLASSLHGEFRATNDIDIVAEFEPGQLNAFMADVSEAFVADAEQAQQAIVARGSFNLIHKGTFLKVDVFPVASDFNREAVRRAESVTFPRGTVPVRVATKEDILLAKVNWYKLGGESSETQRRDVERLIALNRHELDVTYLAQWSEALGLGDLLRRFGFPWPNR